MRLEIFPTFQIHISLDEFHSVDLVHGYYQIRFRSKATFPFPFHIHCDQNASTVGAGDNRPCVVGGAGISKFVKIGFGEQSSELLDVFKCTLNIHKRVDRLETVNVELQVELWYLDPELLPRLENCRFVSKRTMNILLKPDRSTHCHRPIFFEYFSFSAVSLTIHASMIAATVRRKKTGDPPLSDKLRSYHRDVCFRMLSCCFSLQNFIKRYSSILVSPLNIELIDVGNEEAALQGRLELSSQPWLKLQEHVAELNNRLSQLFTQLLQLFGNNKELREVMLGEFDQQRLKRLSEAFIVSEDSVQSLLNPIPNPNLKYFEIMKKNAYLNKIKILPVHVEQLDADSLNLTMIVEHKYLPRGSVTYSPELPRPSFIVNTCEPDGETEEPVLSPSIFEAAPQPPRRESTTKIPFCLPVTSAADAEDAYEAVNGSKERFLSVNNDRLTKRRMTDPGSAMQVEIEELPRRSPKMSMCLPSPGGLSAKAKSTSNISHDGDEDDDSVYCHAETPSTSSESLDAGRIERKRSRKQHRSTISQRSNSHAADAFLHVETDVYALIKQKEELKAKLHNAGFRGCLYSDQAYLGEHVPYFSAATKLAIEKRRFVDAHLIIFVHGLEGTCEDLSAYRNLLRVALPDCHLLFLMSEVNQTETWTDMGLMANNLLEEMKQFIQKLPRPPAKISFLAHSLGGLIVRTLCGLKAMDPFLPKLHTLLTLNSPHCGLMYNQRAANWGITLLQWWKQSVSLEQLTMRDAVNYRDTFLYKLSCNGVFGLFKHVLLVGCYHDLYVPGHSALVDVCKGALHDPSEQGRIYQELVHNLNESVVESPRNTTLVKYVVSHTVASRVQQVTGRAVHIAAVDDDHFIEKLLTVSAIKYFR